jgi:prepilin-type N-terminal cleavage/methylation domain-containing protein
MAQRHNNAGNGVTLIELVVALSIAGIVISLVMFSWTFIARHTEMQKRKAQFHAQSELIASIVSNDVRRASQVVSFNENSVTFVAQTGDTVSYRLRNDSLFKNDSIFLPVSDGAKVVKFSATEEGQTYPTSSGAQNAVLNITLGAEGISGLASEIQTRVNVQLSSDIAGGAERSWNY